MYEYCGAIHIHSLFSDGSGEIPDIANFASEVNLDFIVMTDHNTLRGLKEGYERFYNNTLVLIGCEVNDKDNKNHLLVLGIEEALSTRIPAKEYTAIAKKLGGLSFLAHPHEKRVSFAEHPAYPWTEWDSEDFSGIEIWNHMSEWMESLTEQNKYQSFLHPLRTIVAPNSETLAVWDKISQTRKVVGIGGIDAHAHKVSMLGFFEVEVFPYKVLFKSIRTHILTSQKIIPGSDKEAIASGKTAVYEALRYGNCFVSNFYHGDARGFRFFGEDAVQAYGMGDTIILDKSVKLRVYLPGVNATIRLIRNGKLYDEVDGFGADFYVVQKGTYRVEVHYRNQAWIYSNHIRIL